MTAHDHSSSTTTIVTSDVPPAVDAARRVLAAALDADLPPAPDGGIDVDRLTVAEALAVLDDVTPPYPPLPDRLAPVAADDARRQALAHLDTALDEVTCIRDLTRIGLAALVLRRGGGVAA